MAETPEQQACHSELYHAFGDVDTALAVADEAFPESPFSEPVFVGKAGWVPQQDAIIMVMRVQVELVRLGHYKGKIDGKMGPATKEALRAFQRAEGLAVTGVMDNTTLAKLGIAG